MSGTELFSCDNIETYAAHVILLFFFLKKKTLLPVDVEQCYRHVICFIIFFYPLLLGLCGLLGNVVTLKTKKKMGRM